jgi:hypothetical protein
MDGGGGSVIVPIMIIFIFNYLEYGILFIGIGVVHVNI